MPTKTIFIALTAFLCGLSSCKEEVPYAVKDVSEIEIQFQSPEAQSTWSAGNEIHVEGIIDADAMMGGWSISIASDTGEEISYYRDVFDQTQYLFHYHWYSAQQDTGNIVITVNALNQNQEVLKSKSVSIYCQ